MIVPLIVAPLSGDKTVSAVVPTGVGVAVGVGAGVGVLAGVGVTTGVAVTVGVGAGVGVLAGVGVTTGVAVTVGVGAGVGVLAGVGVTTGVAVTVGVGVEPLLTVTATDTVARTALLVEKALITNVCEPLDTVVVSKLILQLPPDGPHIFPLPVPSG